MHPPAPAQPAQPVILVATDLSAAADEAVRAGFAQALAHGARLVVAHVLDDGAGDATAAATIAPVRTTIARAIGGGGDDRAAVDALVLTGEPCGAIVAAAAARAAALIVVAAHGGASLRRQVLGGVAGRVVRHAPCAVLVARPPFGLRILVATDLSALSLPALAAAADEARRRGVAVTALHCLDPLADGVAPAAAEDELARARARLSAAVQDCGLDAELVVERGDAAEIIARAAAGVAADLVVVATHGRTGLRRILLGSTAEAVVRSAPCSVLVVRSNLP
ncbi:MAG: universal stress protein [Myxococcales bacterium]|nr:universal stress protein [Myxococcales bacterium]